jgi:hypothetical protein
MEFSVRRQFPPNTNSYAQEENSGSTRKFVQNYLLFTCISNLILAIHTQSINGLEEPFAMCMGWRNLSKTAEKSSSSPRAAVVLMLFTWRSQLGYPAHTGLISLSVCLFVRPFVYCLQYENT